MKANQRRKRDSGVALLEFSLAMFTVLLLLFGIIDIGRALFTYDWVSDAARQATRFAMVRGSDCSGLSGGCPASADNVNDYVTGLATGLDPSQITVASECVGGKSPSLPCDPKASVRVTVQYNFHFVSPLAFQSWTMSSRSERVVQN
jgi:Flp pilus assembly protein TadG